MSYYKAMQRAVDYMEANLKGEVTLAGIASACGYSVPHFHRVFGALAGVSAGEYLRRRRLSEAMVAVMASRGGIIDIALDFGFESHEAFTRAFRAVYGAPPSAFRKRGAEPLLYPKLNIISMKKEGIPIMNPNILFKEAKNLIGISRRMTQGDNIREGLIGQVRREFEAMADSVPGRVNPHLFYAAYDYEPAVLLLDDDHTVYTYWYCVQSDAEPAGRMQKKAIPRARYAVFQYDTKTGTLNGEAIGMQPYDYIDGVWLPQSGMEVANTPDYEVYDTQTGLMEINISIQ